MPIPNEPSPAVDLCGMCVTRLIIRANPFGGYSHRYLGWIAQVNRRLKPEMNAAPVRRIPARQEKQALVYA